MDAVVAAGSVLQGHPAHRQQLLPSARARLSLPRARDQAAAPGSDPDPDQPEDSGSSTGIIGPAAGGGGGGGAQGRSVEGLEAGQALRVTQVVSTGVVDQEDKLGFEVWHNLGTEEQIQDINPSVPLCLSGDHSQTKLFSPSSTTLTVEPVLHSTKTAGGVVEQVLRGPGGHCTALMMGSCEPTR
eukprot:2362914-Rhodomonas_salina.3